MDMTADERAVLARFAQKTQSAGGPRSGYVLRRVAVIRGVGDADAGAGIAGLVERGWLAASEGGDFLFLTESGVEALAAA